LGAGTRGVALATALVLLCVCCNKPKEAKVEAVFVGKNAVCARVAGGSVRCAGPGGGVLSEPGQGFREVPALKGATQIALSESSGCAQVPHGLSCFGPPFRATIAAPAIFDAQSLPVAQLAATDAAVCVADPSASVRCFDASGKLGAQVYRGTSVAAGGGALCVLGNDGLVACHGTLEGVSLSGVAPGVASALAVSSTRVCGIGGDGAVVCARKSGAEPAMRVGAAEIALQGDTLCVTHKNKTLSCEDHGVLRPVSGVFAVKGLSGGGGNACFVGQEQVAFCWGDNAHAELGTQQPGPREVPAALFFRQIP
jgi:hypothetical protein